MSVAPEILPCNEARRVSEIMIAARKGRRMGRRHRSALRQRGTQSCRVSTAPGL